MPEQGKNITIYEENLNISYIGDISNFTYNGKGKKYKDLYLFYEGGYLEGKRHGKGIIYYSNGKACYEGNFKNDEFFGEGIKYYDNGAKKMEGIFETFNCCKGKYYSPDNQLLYEGKILNEIPEDCKSIKIYNDYTFNEYIRDINNGQYECIYQEYKPDFFIYNKINIINKLKCGENIILPPIPFLSFNSYSGKSALILRMFDPNFNIRKYISTSTIGFEFKKFEFQKYDMQDYYKIQFKAQ